MGGKTRPLKPSRVFPCGLVCCCCFSLGLQTLFKQCLEGRELGPEITSLLLHISNLRLLWQLAAATAAADSNAAGIAAYVQQRSAFVKVLEALLESGASEQLVTPEQLLSGQWWNTNRRAGGSSSSNAQVPAELAEQLSVGLHTLQDLAFLLLTDLIFLENGNAAGQQQAATAGSSRRAAAGAGAFGQLSVSSNVLDRLWRYCCDVLEREAPEVATGDGAEEEDAIEDDEEDVFDDYDTQGTVKCMQQVRIHSCLVMSHPVFKH